jgi:hypothetical protein
MNREDYFNWKDFRESTSQTLNNEEYEFVCHLHSKLFLHSYYKPCPCSPKTIVQWIKDLNIKFKESKKYRVRKKNFNSWLNEIDSKK